MNSRLIHTFWCLALLLGAFTASHAQEVTLSADEAVRIALEQNYNVKAAENDRTIAENNTSKLNTGQLPVVTGTAGANYNFNRAVNKLEGAAAVKENTNGFPFSAGVAVNYVLFDKNRKYTIDQLGNFYTLSDLQVRQEAELLVLELLSNYYRVARLEQGLNVNRENLEVSKRNLTRAVYAFEYGVTSKLGVLNNEVNLNNDSIALRNSLVAYDQARRDLNVLMGRDARTVFRTDTIIDFVTDLTLEALLADAGQNNIFIRLADQGMAIDQLSIDQAKTGWLPTLSTGAAYNWRDQFNVNSPVDHFGNNGFTGGLNLSWNIFDGGRTKNAIQNAAVSYETSRLYREEIVRQVERDVLNGWQAWQNALVIMEAQEKNIETAQHNFDRTSEQYKLGNATITTLREAQNNLLNTRLGYFQAIYEAKLYELQLLQLSGRLVN